jgi:hypothetical protein
MFMKSVRNDFRQEVTIPDQKDDQKSIFKRVYGEVAETVLDRSSLVEVIQWKTKLSRLLQCLTGNCQRQTGFENPA